MAHVWKRDTDTDAWHARNLRDGEIVELTDTTVLLLCEADAFVVASTPSGPRVNGATLHGGLRRLRDRDEIRTANGATFWFGAITPARVEPLPASVQGIRCARSRTPLKEGDPSVCCPCCGSWYAQSDSRPAWTYGSTCVVCGTATGLDGSLPWSPSDFEENWHDVDD